MTIFSRRWRPRHLLLGWLVYWVALVAVTLAPAIAAIVRMSREANGQGGVSAAFGDGLMTLTVSQKGVTTYTGSMSFLSLVLLLAVPPLILWLVWLFGASRTNNAGETRARNASQRNELNAAEPRIGIVDASNSKRSALEES